MTDRIAILHYSSAPAVGGVESIITAQRAALRDAGRPTRLITGSGDVGPEDVLIEALVPGAASEPESDEVEAIRNALDDALKQCSQCWIHNALTVNLNPALTAALVELIVSKASIRWVCWTEDISAASEFVANAGAQSLPPNLDHVAISNERADQLARIYSIPRTDIQVIGPPLDCSEWLGLGAQAKALTQALDLVGRDIVVFVPAKLLPHKNLEIAVRLAAALKALVPDPLVMVSAASSPHEPERSQRLTVRLRELAGQLGADPNFILLREVLDVPLTRQSMRDLMLLSDLIFLPSLEEGFGIPVLEASALRVPLLLSDIPAFQEAAGDSAEYFSASSYTVDWIAAEWALRELAEKALRLTAEPVNRARRQALGSHARFKAEIAQLAGVKHLAGFA